MALLLARIPKGLLRRVPNGLVTYITIECVHRHGETFAFWGRIKWKGRNQWFVGSWHRGFARC